MEQNLKDLIKPMIINGKQVTLMEKDKNIGMKENVTSKYIKSFDCYIRGELNNPNEDKRNAVISGIYLRNGKKCKTILCVF